MSLPHLLLIDDDVQLRRVYARSLSRHFIVTPHADVESALITIDAGKVYDAILCDLNLVRMTGRDLYEHLRGRGHVLAERLVIITGQEPASSDDFTTKFLSSERYLVKTCSFQELSATLLRLAAPRVSPVG